MKLQPEYIKEKINPLSFMYMVYIRACENKETVRFNGAEYLVDSIEPKCKGNYLLIFRRVD